MIDPIHSDWLATGFEVPCASARALMLMLPVAVVLVYWRELRALLGRRWMDAWCGFRATPIRLALVFAMACALVIGSTKGPGGYGSARIAQFITALTDGRVIDDSGVVAKFAEGEAVRYFNGETAGIMLSASNTLRAAQTNVDSMVYDLTSRPRRVAYICADLPRADPQQHTNSNIAATIQRVDVTGGVVRAWVWFSEDPFQAPNISFDASVSDGSWVQMTAFTNSFPATTSINGVPCVRYDFAVPDGMQGVPLRPGYELAWGGFETNSLLVVPAGGIMVSTNGVSMLPFTGWERHWPEPWGTNLEIRYAGGIAIEARWCGTNVTGEVAL